MNSRAKACTCGHIQIGVTAYKRDAKRPTGTDEDRSEVACQVGEDRRISARVPLFPSPPVCLCLVCDGSVSLTPY